MWPWKCHSMLNVSYVFAFWNITAMRNNSANQFHVPYTFQFAVKLLSPNSVKEVLTLIALPVEAYKLFILGDHGENEHQKSLQDGPHYFQGASIQMISLYSFTIKFPPLQTTEISPTKVQHLSISQRRKEYE